MDTYASVDSHGIAAIIEAAYENAPPDYRHQTTFEDAILVQHRGTIELLEYVSDTSKVPLRKLNLETRSEPDIVHMARDKLAAHPRARLQRSPSTSNRSWSELLQSSLNSTQM